MRGHRPYGSGALGDSTVAPQDLPQEALVLRHADLVKRIAYHLVSRMPPSVEVDDLIQAGMIGLLDAARHYTASKGANFETYAGIRIRGAMLDEVRKSDWTPRSVHRSARAMADAVRRVENATGHEAKPAEIATELGISLDDYYKTVQDAVSCRLFSFEQVGGGGDDDNGSSPADFATDGAQGPLENLTEDDFRAALGTAIQHLPEREKLVLSLYYDDELNLREIGEVLEVSESRVCQIHGQALVRLRARLDEWLQK
jgi:RNA polymerase sigma factor for flagellar operon FliA